MSSRPRLLAASALVAGILLAVRPGVGAWPVSTTITAPLSVAQIGSSLVQTGGAGSVSSGTYALGGLLFPATGYVDVVNSSTIPATLGLTITMASLVAGTTVTQCSAPWNQTAGTCPGTSTLIASSVLLALPLFPYTFTSVTPAGTHLYLQVAVAGVLAGVTVALNAPVVRSPGDRTSG